LMRRIATALLTMTAGTSLAFAVAAQPAGAPPAGERASGQPSRSTRAAAAKAPVRSLVLPASVAGDTAPAPPGGSIFFVGTATVIIRYAGFTVLTDPNFLHKGDHAHLGYGLSSPRITDPAIDIDHLPPIDLVVLSHFHGDHFDQIVQRQLARQTPIVTTPHAAAALRKLGFTAVQPLRTWETLDVARGESHLQITSMPGRHGPAGMAKAMPQTMGSLLDFAPAAGANGYRLYISGDTLVYSQLRDIPKRYPGIDLALLHLGGTRVFGVLVTMDARQGIEALQILQPETAIPIHYDDYRVFKSPLSDFVAAVERAGLQAKVRYLKRGETYEFTPARR
jgi:L-ascorbate metabolism protein UlaG (beta-lactamase superfamily)